MRIDFCPPVRELPPRPYFWFSLKPATVLLFDTNEVFSAPHTGHLQSAGKLWREGRGDEPG